MQLPPPGDVQMIRHPREALSSRPTLPNYVPWSCVYSRTRRNYWRSSKRPADWGSSADEEAEDGGEMVGLSVGTQGDGEEDQEGLVTEERTRGCRVYTSAVV